MRGTEKLSFLHILLFLAVKESRARELSKPTFCLPSLTTNSNESNIVYPTVLHTRTKREISSTRDNNGAHYSEVQVSVPVEGEQWVLELQLNEDLVTEGHTLQYQQGGETVQHKPTREELELCHYSGSVRGKPQSWAAVSTCRGVRAAIFDGAKMINIEPVQGTEIQSAHYLHEIKHLSLDHNLGVLRGGVTTENTDETEPSSQRRLRERSTASERLSGRYKRASDNEQVREPYNANQLSRYVELVIIADHSVFKASGNSIQAVHSHMIQVANVLNSIYSPLNIYVALVGVVVWSERDEILISKTMSETLSNLKSYRRKLVDEIPNDSSPLVTRQSFSEGYAGLAYVNTMCSPESSCSVVRICSRCDDLPIVMAHEVGHNLGLNHDKDNCMCQARKTCIMQGIPHSSEGIGMWSNCSVEFLANSSETHRCVHNVPKRLFKSPTCGNGFVEPGEQCDCGTHGYRTGQPAGPAGGGTNPCHACCHPDTCMLRVNATCVTGACCDLTTCSVKSAGVMCRAAERECDLPEYCSGHSEYCPADVYKMDSTPCGVGDNQAYCVRGACNSHADHCRLLWGASGTNHDECYFKNTEGIYYGSCGYDPISRRYIACAPSDTRCGLLQCRTQEYRLHHANTVKWTYAKNNQKENCSIAYFNVESSNFGLGLVPDGAKCGRDRMCLRQKCVSNHESSFCSSNCSGHGICNSKGQCHCEAGFGPPWCSAPGPGGSVDSGPATDNTVQRYYMISMYIIFLGIIPSIALPLFVYYWRQNVLCWWRQPWKPHLNYFTCCNKKQSKTIKRNKFVNNASTLAVKTYSRESTETKKKINKDDIQVVSSYTTKTHSKTIERNKFENNASTLAVETNSRETIQPKKNFNKDNIQVVSNNTKLKPIEAGSNTNENTIQTVNNHLEFEPAQPILNNNKDNILTEINNVRLKPVKSVSKINIGKIYATTNQVKLNPADAMSNVNNENIKIAISNVKLKPVKPMPNISNDAKIPSDIVEKACIKPALNTNPNDIQTAIMNVKLKPTKINPKIIKSGSQTSTNQY